MPSTDIDERIDIEDSRLPGAVLEKLDDGLEAIIRHARRMTTLVKPSTITITVVVTPDDERQQFGVKVSAKTTFAPEKPFTTSFLGGVDKNGEIIAKSVQTSMFGKDK